MSKLLKSLQKCLKQDTEFTIEANPESLDEDKVKLFLDSGINRLSIGAQSFRDKKLRMLGRIHDSRKAKEAVWLASKRGFKNIGIDLIFGVWEENIEAWKKEIEEAVKLPLTHISSYSLTYEKSTPLFEAVKNGSVKPLADDLAAGMYEAAIEGLAVRGFGQYEVSNFAKAGYECRHNLNYWNNNSYMGLGASAVSYIDGVREANIRDVGEYIRRMEMKKTPVVSSEKLSPVRRAKETAAVKIRTRDGIDFAWFKEKTGFDFQELEKRAIPKLIENGLLKYRKENGILTGVHLKRKGLLLCDMVSSEFL